MAMKRNIIICLSYAGVALSIAVTVLVVSFVIYDKMDITHPLEGSTVAALCFLASPLLLAFQGLAIVMTKKSDMTGLWRIAVYLVNGLGVLMCGWLVTGLVLLWLTGPINSG